MQFKKRLTKVEGRSKNQNTAFSIYPTRPISPIYSSHKNLPTGSLVFLIASVIEKLYLDAERKGRYQSAERAVPTPHYLKVRTFFQPDSGGPQAISERSFVWMPRNYPTVPT